MVVNRKSKDYSKSRRRRGDRDRRRSREPAKEEKDLPASCGFLSNDGFLWTETSPDLKLIEPRILVSVNYNYLEFSRKSDRPPERRTICLVNHGDHPIAFQLQTTDNVSYFVDRKFGVIPPRQTAVNASVRMANVAIVQVFHRPHKEYKESERTEFYNQPHKDKLFVLLAPQFCQTFSPQAIFHNERCYEKLRIMLRYSGIEQKPGDTRPKQLLLHGIPGWATWREENDRKKKNAKQIDEFVKIEKKIIENASKEAIIDDPPNVPVVPSPHPARLINPLPGLGARREALAVIPPPVLLAAASPFGRQEAKGMRGLRKTADKKAAPPQAQKSAGAGTDQKTKKSFEVLRKPKEPRSGLPQVVVPKKMKELHPLSGPVVRRSLENRDMKTPLIDPATIKTPGKKMNSKGE